jgi:hypothetical protein
MVLPYLRPEHVPIGRQQCAEGGDFLGIIAAHPALQQFLDYFDHQWITRIEDWNVFALEDHRTNNDVEGWHYEFNNRLTKHDRALGFWPFVELIGTRVDIDDEGYAQVMGGQLLASRSTQSIDRQESIMRMRSLYNNNSISIDHSPEGCVRAYMRGLKNSY